MRSETRAAIDAINEGIEAYRRVFSLGPGEELGVRQEFAEFHLRAQQHGSVGVQWDFGPCLMCPEGDEIQGCRRALFCHPAAMTNGRALAGVLCHDHDKYFGPDHALAPTTYRGGFRRLRVVHDLIQRADLETALEAVCLHV